MDQFGAAHPRGTGSTVVTTDSTPSSAKTLFRPAQYIIQKNASVADDISAVTMPLLEKFPNATAQELMAHGDLRYEDIRVGNKGACLNYNLLGMCSDQKCTYRHTKAKRTQERVQSVTSKLQPAIQNFMAAGAPSNAPVNKRKQD
jgi:hypothetical protein